MLVFVTPNKTRRAALVEHLNRNGVFVYLSSPEGARLTVHKKDTGGVLLDAVGNLGACERLAEALLREYPAMPIAAIVARDAVPQIKVNALLRDTDEQVLSEQVLDFCICQCGWHTKPLSTYRLTVGDVPEATLYMGYRLPLSPKEHEILRCLFYRMPHDTTADDLLSLCYPNHPVKRENLTAMIRRINKKAEAIDPHPLIVNRYGKGYRLRDGILD